eukprot:CAMPEP_0197842284 /NCGR_PEP_ID=MMETSP1437-20131217/46653_1 /TAXON_ID=49252 ORGANISM="Eucampia antarctica, Strain CCMP1452" /NCGR_SAMPLE_ID=MMETSP1437 /ASSEMBLY_ACC=CAM_ASM_001096 /LENGTH=479 /DNA_ID=CAMNT_0043452141 /DNA_START=1160 /DNA_END=2595 /DNA_ORIENTATION=-
MTRILRLIYMLLGLVSLSLCEEDSSLARDNLRDFSLNTEHGLSYEGYTNNTHYGTGLKKDEGALKLTKIIHSSTYSEVPNKSNTSIKQEVQMTPRTLKTPKKTSKKTPKKTLTKTPKKTLTKTPTKTPKKTPKTPKKTPKTPKTPNATKNPISTYSTINISILIFSSSGINAAAFNTDLPAQDLVREVLEQCLALPSTSIEPPKFNRKRKLATYISDLSFVSASEAISGTFYSYLNYDYKNMTSDSASTASTAQEKIDALAAAGTLTTLLNQKDTVNKYGFSGMTTVAAERYEISITVTTKCTDGVFVSDGVDEALRRYHLFVNEIVNQGFTNVGIANLIITTTKDECTDYNNSKLRKLTGTGGNLDSLIQYELKGDGCGSKCPDQGLSTVKINNEGRKLVVACEDEGQSVSVQESDQLVIFFNEFTNNSVTEAPKTCNNGNKKTSNGFVGIIINSPNEESTLFPSVIPSADIPSNIPT